eukprot:GHVT01004126.1.p1 GENE.GHVT01004126.1~~GHVT01004126.1.p1  ORF type:complete len:346 (+),score=97.22 GHVT01004126.1:789-1826(+)
MVRVSGPAVAQSSHAGVASAVRASSRAKRVAKSAGDAGVASPVADRGSKPRPRGKDPNAPKKPCSSYMLFSSARRRQAGGEGAAVSIQRIAAEWRALSAEARRPYEHEATEERSRYAQLMAEYNQGKPKKVGTARPKPPLTPYLLFSFARRKDAGKHESHNYTEVAKLIDAKWKTLTDQQQEPYVQLAVQDKLRFQLAMKLNQEAKQEHSDLDTQATADEQNLDDVELPFDESHTLLDDDDDDDNDAQNEFGNHLDLTLQGVQMQLREATQLEIDQIAQAELRADELDPTAQSVLPANDADPLKGHLEAEVQPDPKEEATEQEEKEDEKEKEEEKQEGVESSSCT